jgi:hypothetical protein
LKELGIHTNPHVSSDSQSLVTRIKSRIYCATAVEHSATKYYLAEDMARDGEIDLSYIPIAEMLANSFNKPLTMPGFFTQCASMRMIGIGLWNGLRNDLGIGFGNGLGIGIGNGVGIGIGICLGNGRGNGI